MISPKEFFPPTPAAYSLFYNVFKYFGWAGMITTIFPQIQAMGRNSVTRNKLNIPGRYAWAIAESIGPLYMTYIVYTLPGRLEMPPSSTPTTSYLGTGLPVWHEVMYLLYMIHYLNRAIMTPLVYAPSMSPIHAFIFMAMSIFQFLNAGSIGSWIVYSSVSPYNIALRNRPFAYGSVVVPLIGLNIWVIGYMCNILSERTLFRLRREAAARKARSEGKFEISYDKVYVIPPATEFWFRHMMFPHYLAEWMEWFGFWLIGIGAGMIKTGIVETDATGRTPAFWFLSNEVMIMLPRARDGLRWYQDRFGERAVAGRGSVLPFGWF